MRQLIGRFSLLLASIAALFCGIAACGSQTETITWKEEVALHDGRTIVVARSVTLGGVRREIGQGPGISKSTLSFTAPDGKQVYWENPGQLNVMLLDFEGTTPFLAGEPAMVSDYARYGCPNPSYVFFRYANEWLRIEFKDSPSFLRKTNLLIPSKKWLANLQNRTLQREEVDELNSDLSKHYRTIDPNRSSPDGCEKTRFVN